MLVQIRMTWKTEGKNPSPHLLSIHRKKCPMIYFLITLLCSIQYSSTGLECHKGRSPFNFGYKSVTFSHCCRLHWTKRHKSTSESPWDKDYSSHLWRLSAVPCSRTGRGDNTSSEWETYDVTAWQMLILTFSCSLLLVGCILGWMTTAKLWIWLKHTSEICMLWKHLWELKSVKERQNLCDIQ